MTTPNSPWQVAESGDEQLDAFLQRGRRGGTILAAAGMLIFAASVVFSFVRLKQIEREIGNNEAVIAQQVETLRAQESQIALNQQRLETMAPAALRGFGWDGETVVGAAIDSVAVQRSLTAHDALAELVRLQPQRADSQRIVYYAKGPTIDANQENFVASLRELGFAVEVVRPINPSRGSNALWFGSDVDPVAAQMVGYAMIRAGYDLQYVGRFQDPTGRKSHIIEIGVRPQSAQEPTLTPAALERALSGTRAG
jgi:hypothetical protein